MGNNYRTNAVLPVVLTLTLYLVFTMTLSHPVRNKNIPLTKVKLHKPEVKKKDGVVGIHHVSKRSARPDTSGVFLNHFPVTNLLSKPDKKRRMETIQGHNSVLHKPASGTSAFRNTQRVIDSNPTPTEWMEDQSLHRRGKDSLPNAIYKNSVVRKPSDRQVTRNNERKDKVQAWKDLSDKLMSSWGDLGSDTATPGGEPYAPRTPSFTFTTESVNNPSLHAINYAANENERTGPVLRESIEHGPAIVRTRIPNTRQTIIGYAELSTTPSSNDKFNGGYFTEPGVVSTSKPFTTSTTYPIKRPRITTDRIDRIGPTNTRRRVGKGYDFVPRQYGESVYHRPSQVHTRTLVKESWKTIERGLPNASIAVSDTEYSNYALSNNTSDPIGYAIPVSQWDDTHNTRASERVNTHPYDQDTQINNITDNFLDPLNSKIGNLAIGDKYDSSTVKTRFVETKPNQDNMVTLPSGTSDQTVDSDIYFTSTNEYSFSESIPKEDRTIGSVGDASELAANISLSPASTVGYHSDTSTPHNEQMTSATGGTLIDTSTPHYEHMASATGGTLIDTYTPNYEQMTSASGGTYIDTYTPNYEQMTSATGVTIDQYRTTIETTRRGESLHTTPVYTTVKNEGQPSTINIKVNQTRAPIQSDASTVSKAQIRTTSTQTPMVFTKPVIPKRTPSKMKVYDIKEVLQDELEKKARTGKGRKQKFRKITQMKVYDMTDPVINKNNQNSPAKHNRRIEEFTSKSNSPKAHTGQYLMQDILKVQRLSNNTKNSTDSEKTVLRVNQTSHDQPGVFGRDGMLEVQGHTVLTNSKNQEKGLKSTKYQRKRFVVNGKVVINKSVRKEPELTERTASAKWNEINALDKDTNNDDLLSKRQPQTLDKSNSVYDNQANNVVTNDNQTSSVVTNDNQASSVVTNANQTKHNGTDVPMHHHNRSACNDSDTHHITRAISVIKNLIDKIQAKPIVKALPQPHRQRYLLIPLGNLTFTEIKQKLLAYQTYMHDFRNDHWSDNSLVKDVNTDKRITPIILDHRPIQG